MTIPRDAIGLSERLRKPVCLSYNAEYINAERREAATQLDALRSEINEWANEVARYKAYAEKFDQENTELRARVKELEATDRYANLISIIADIREKSGLGGKPMLSELADAVWAKIASAESRATRAEQERDEVLERARKAARNAILHLSQEERLSGDICDHAITTAIRRLAAGPDDR